MQYHDEHMGEILIIIFLIVAWVVLNAVILPKLGIKT
jgi:hypothetical protein